MATKIKKLLDIIPRDSLLFSSWMAKKGIDRKEQTLYTHSGWLERIAQGVYKIEGSKPTLYGAIASYNRQLGKQCHIGAASALELRGFSHFIVMGKPAACLFTEKENRLPLWLSKGNWDIDVHYYTTSVFPKEMGLETIEDNGRELLISSPERAIMECLHLSPELYNLMDVYYLMEMLTALRPNLVQDLLESCSSVKVKRLFLYMAEKAAHFWFKSIDQTKISLGRGKRVIGENGKYIGKYQITIPAELVNYE
ncbi:MAG: type IV toxin-antitoxin system AbiEi family antitoxin [Bacteroidales bacterium]|nr:type IV toxin-antitoxin system AbiEi family antitoxin [Bacteroidales bacterium]